MLPTTSLSSLNKVVDESQLPQENRYDWHPKPYCKAHSQKIMALYSCAGKTENFGAQLEAGYGNSQAHHAAGPPISLMSS